MKRLLIYLSLITGPILHSQDYYNDAQFRFNLGIEAKITKRFGFTFNQQDRWQKNVSDLNRASFDFGLSYKINRFMRVKADYVLIQKKNKFNYFLPRNWFYVALFLKKDFKRWKIVDRNLLQLRNGITNSEEAYVQRYYYRNKLTLKYEITKRFEGWVAEEVYIPLNSPQAQGIDRTRSFIGITMVTFKGQSIDFYFMYQAYLQKNEWFNQKNKYDSSPLKRNYIFGINYFISF
jgi:hypothetical protein